MNDVALRLDGFGVSFGERMILSNVTFDLPRKGLTVLVGPAGGGKSTLLRTLAGLNDGHTALGVWGRVRFADDQRPSIVMQHARFFLDTVRENLVSALPQRASLEPRDQTQLVIGRLIACGLRELTHALDRNAVDLPLPLQRRLAIARALVPEPAILFADEPAAGLDENDAIEVVAMLRAQARERSIVLTTHNQRMALAAGGTAILLAGGKIQESAPTADFFRSPESDLGREFVRTGGCSAPSPDARAESLEDTVLPPTIPPASLQVRSRFVGPRGFFWVIPGKLGGLPRPGIVDDLAHDVAGLARLGVSLLVTLEETHTVDVPALAECGIKSVHFPIVDMGVPELYAALAFCAEMENAMNAGAVVAMHCRAGLGRTGTMLACQLIWSGRSALAAIETVRAINPRCIQSDAQVEFLRQFDVALEGAAALGVDGDPRRQGDRTWH